MLRLSVLDQSPIAHGLDAREALHQTVQVAQTVERLGFHRLWVSEHHDTASLAGSTPEILMAHLAANTRQIRIGSGGVMLPHYSAYKVAENFRMLEALHPGRIDVGLGRAPGGMPTSTRALQEGKIKEINYSQQVEDLVGYLTDTPPAHARFGGLVATPVIDTVPQIWLLGSSHGSAQIAAEQGTAFMFAHFINGDGGSDAVRLYKRQFKASALNARPQSSVAIFVICADTDAEANRIASSLDLALILLASGQRSTGTPTIEMAQSYPYTDYEQAWVRENRKRMIVGGPLTVKQKIEELALAYDTNEVMITTMAAEFEHRLRSFELVAQAFGLPQGLDS
ncbi:MAG: hypothetical protein A2201_02155 [Alicyclobacillus sp. RIFOXYA1_FULL_53_8]|nr:MAG: hypothetical protein A2201_02155 [Alicyclobacillus sp. RIFOXYA1_FULL_53_8]